jgi:hypothetical protein
MRIKGRLLCVLAVLAGLAGCQANQPPLAKVTGRVTYNGLPARAEVVFQPETAEHKSAGRPSLAMTDEHGEFVLQYAEGLPGAVVGPHRVSISLFPSRNEDTQAAQQFIVEKTVRFERIVQAGQTNRFRFVLN